MKRYISLTVAVCMLISLLSGCARNEDAEESYTYNDYVTTMAANWNPHTYETASDSYPADFLRVGLYAAVFNDEKNFAVGKPPFESYKMIPEMAASEPVDVTARVRTEHPEFGIPESANSGYAYTIDLNPEAVWEDGTPINADTYVYSMRRLLDPELLNYRASDFYAGNFSIAGAERYANQGQSVMLKVYEVMERDGIFAAEDFVFTYGDSKAHINWSDSFGEAYNSQTGKWGATENAVVDSGMSVRELYEFFMSEVVARGESADGARRRFADEVSIMWTYPDNVDFSSVGLYKSGDYQITLVLSRALSGFGLLYALTTNWIVNEELYERCLKKEGDAWFSTYNTSADTTLSYGPYKLVSYQKDKSMRFEKNDEWYGYTDGRHVFADPISGDEREMYQTTAINTQVVAESATAKLMFLRGELMSYTLGADDFAAYKNSEFAHETPGETIFFLILNGNMEAIQKRESSGSFDRRTIDLETMTLEPFRRALALTYDREQFAAAISPARSAAYGLIGNAYLYDPENQLSYRDTNAAKYVLCDFYGVDPSKYQSLDAAVGSITGYDPDSAREYYKEAFSEALALGYITDNDKNGISDQTVTIEYCVSADNDFMTRTIDYLNGKMSAVTAGTPFEGKISFIKSAPYGTEWSQKIKAGLSDTVLGGWSGSVLDPFSLTDLYVNPAYQYDALWFDSDETELTMSINVGGMGEVEVIRDVTMTLREWSDALNGEYVTKNNVAYNFGEGMADVEVRLSILAALEGEILRTYNYIPMLQDAALTLLSKHAYYAAESYNPVLGWGGIAYLGYNYSDAEWAEYVSSVGGDIKY